MPPLRTGRGLGSEPNSVEIEKPKKTIVQLNLYQWIMASPYCQKNGEPAAFELMETKQLPIG